MLNPTLELEDWPFILKVNLLLSIFFLIITLLFVGLVLYLRIQKNFKEAHRKKLETKFIDFANTFLFDDSINKSKELANFKFDNIKSSYDYKILIKQVLIFDENLKGESTALIKEIFYGLGLYRFLLKDLKRKEWFNKARALFAFSKLGIAVPDQLIMPLLQSKRVELKQHAILYFLNTSKTDPLVFLDNLEGRLTLWQQVLIENSLKSFEVEIPDFARWLNHKEDSIVVFCIKMILSFNQFQNIPFLIDCLDHTSENVRHQAIQVLQAMEVSEALQLMVAHFPEETPANKRSILYAISKIGAYKDLQTLVPHIHKEEENLQIDFYKISGLFDEKIPVKKLLNIETISKDWEDFQQYSINRSIGA
ncbi:HEAT repeat domain-containing protein [Leeuwenhoekiella aestuarii]|uniref:HEAT repeat protein n=1 Tax=Leeuwenhoekiella aestuarii TaxID=2249426 RepID=A0A4Q0NVK2_9FLAO|nr:HEAT repeat domain-containing protein [Leeuwenhoekiella aestuarii]RXG15725.1 hypothetical protein DSM04_103614 [Leeuwenhoekiella aestuarii]